jgi:hypothetical protein
LVFYLAAKSFLAGEPVYYQQFGLSSGYFKYSPVSLFAFIPLSFTPYIVAKSIYYLISMSFASCVIILSKRLWNNISGEKIKKSIYALLLVSLISFSHLFRDLQLGNINILLLFALIVSLNLIRGGKNINAGIVLGLVLLFKPHFLVLIPLLILRKKIKIIATIALTVIAGLIIPAFVTGLEYNFALLSEWYDTMLMHNQSFHNSNNTIHILLFRLFAGYIFPGAGSVYVAINIAIIAALVLLFVLINKKKEQKPSTQEFKSNNFSFEYLLLISLVPSLVHTDTEHFLFSIPIIMYIIVHLFKYKSTVLIIISMISFLLYVGTWGDLLGKYSYYLEHYGSLGTGNIMIVLISLWVFFKNSKESLTNINNENID